MDYTLAGPSAQNAAHPAGALFPHAVTARTKRDPCRLAERGTDLMVADASSQLKIRFAWAGRRQKIVTNTSFHRCAMTSTNYELTTDDLEAHFSEQLGFLDRSAASFDAGFESEAKRLAHTIRILVHDTGTSHSLLGQLNLKDREWLDTCIPDESGNLMTHGGLVAQAIGRKVRWVAMLDEVPIVSKKSFDEWWDAPVFRDDARAR